MDINKIASSWAVRQKWSNHAKMERGNDEMHETTVGGERWQELSRNKRLNSDKRGTVGLEKRGSLWQRQTRGTDGMKITFRWNQPSVMWHFWRITLKKTLKAKRTTTQNKLKWRRHLSATPRLSFYLHCFIKSCSRHCEEPLRAALMWTNSSKVRRVYCVNSIWA